MMTDIESALELIASGSSMTREQARAVMHELATGRASGAQFGALAMGLRVRGETVDEIAGFATAMRELAVPITTGDDPRTVIDTCGTGGDRSGTFNISTAAALVSAGAGARVAKHGNRSVTSSCGSADVLEALGVRIELEPDDARTVLDACGICFLFAPRYHPAMAAVAAHRRELRVRTMFNLLGPLTNPAGVDGQVIGVADPERVEAIAAVLRDLGLQRALVVHGHGGLDEISVSGPTAYVELQDGALRHGMVDPRELGIETAPIDALRGGDASTNAEILRAVLDGERGPRRDATILNSSAALCVAGMAEDIRDGIALAARAIDSGAASAALDAFVAASNQPRVAA